MPPRARRRTLALLLAAAAALACVNLGTLARPVFALIEGDSVCNSTLAMEAHRQVWRESGCEASSSGWRHLTDATEAEEARVAGAFAALPAPDNQCLLPDGGLPAFSGLRLQQLRSDGESRWTVCGLEDGGLAPPFDEAVAAMRALAPAP